MPLSIYPVVVSVVGKHSDHIVVTGVFYYYMLTVHVLYTALAVHSAQLRPVHALKRIAQLQQIQFQIMAISNVRILIISFVYIYKNVYGCV